MDTIRGAVLGEEVQVHLQEEQTQTLIVCLLKKHLFSLIHKFNEGFRSMWAGLPWPPPVRPHAENSRHL